MPGEHRGKTAQLDFWQEREDRPVRYGSSCSCWMILRWAKIVWLWWLAGFHNKGLLSFESVALGFGEGLQALRGKQSCGQRSQGMQCSLDVARDMVTRFGQACRPLDTSDTWLLNSIQHHVYSFGGLNFWMSVVCDLEIIIWQEHTVSGT